MNRFYKYKLILMTERYLKRAIINKTEGIIIETNSIIKMSTIFVIAYIL